MGAWLHIRYIELKITLEKSVVRLKVYPTHHPHLPFSTVQLDLITLNLTPGQVSSF